MYMNICKDLEKSSDICLTDALECCKRLLKATRSYSVIEDSVEVGNCVTPSYQYDVIVIELNNELQSCSIISEQSYYRGLNLFKDISGIQITKEYTEIDKVYYKQMISLLSIMS